MFKLRCVTSFDVTQRRIRINDSGIAQILQRHEIFGFSETIDPTTAECEGAEVFCDQMKELLRARQPEIGIYRITIGRSSKLQ